jgi:hypothetical protein
MYFTILLVNYFFVAIDAAWGGVAAAGANAYHSGQ